jgi:NitT/TauT family transport system substrate-binding protein
MRKTIAPAAKTVLSFASLLTSHAPILFLASLLTSYAAHAESFKVAIPQQGVWDTNIAVWGTQQGYFKDQGLDIDITYTQGGATTEQAVISGSVDFAMATGTLGIISAYAKGAPIRIISAEQTGSPDIFWYARKESGIRSLRDAHGKTVSFSAPGSSSNLVLLQLLDEAGITDAKTVPTGGIPGTLTQVMSGQIDIGWGAPPAPLPDIQDGKLVIVAHANDSPQVRGETIRVNVVNLAVLEAHRDAVIRFAKAYQKSLDTMYSDPKAVDFYAEQNKISRDLALAAKSQFYVKSAVQPYEIKGLQHVLDDAYTAKRIDHPMTPDDVKGLIDIVWKPGP